MKHLRGPILACGLLVLWQMLVFATGVPPYILPGPIPVAKALASHLSLLGGHLTTVITSYSIHYTKLYELNE